MIPERHALFQFFEQTPAAIILLREPSHRIDYCNPAFLATFPPDQWPGGSLEGHTLAEVYPQMREAGLVRLLDRIYATGEPQTVLEMPLADLYPGSPRYLTFAYQPYREQGHIVGVAAFVYDATEQVHARQLAEHLNQELEARVAERTRQVLAATEATERERGLLQAILIQAPVAMALFQGDELLVTAANTRMATLWGYTPAQVIGRPLLEAVPELRGQGFDEQLRQVLQTQVPLTGNEVPATMRRAGELFTSYYNFVYQPLYNAAGEVLGALNVAVDVTEQVLARQQLVQLNQQLERRVAERTTHVELLNQSLDELNQALHQRNRQLAVTNADLDTFIYTASHDLRAPMVNIEGLILVLRQELAEPTPDAEAIAYALKLVDSSVARFQLTLEELSDITRLQQAGSHWQQGGEVDLTALLEGVCLDLTPVVVATQAQLRWQVECSLLYGSAKDLRSICYNLLSNAIKYHHPDRLPGVQLTAACHGPWLELRVQDNGLGLTPAQQGKLFGLFQRLHTHVEGSGVGLYGIKKLVDNAGGTIAVASEAGVGTTFTVRLPQAIAVPAGA